jgi:hypothetical protein
MFVFSAIIIFVIKRLSFDHWWSSERKLKQLKAHHRYRNIEECNTNDLKEETGDNLSGQRSHDQFLFAL